MGKHIRIQTPGPIQNGRDTKIFLVDEDGTETDITGALKVLSVDLGVISPSEVPRASIRCHIAADLSVLPENVTIDQGYKAALERLADGAAMVHTGRFDASSPLWQELQGVKKFAQIALSGSSVEICERQAREWALATRRR
jgi:hypothetical protein